MKLEFNKYFLDAERDRETKRETYRDRQEQRERHKNLDNILEIHCFDPDISNCRTP